MNTVYAKDYQIFPNEEICQIEHFRQMLEEHPGNTRFVLEPGYYHFYKENAVYRNFPVTNSDRKEQIAIAILLENMCNITIDGQRAKFVFHGDLCPITVSECHQLKLCDLSIDFEYPLSAEGRILNVSEKAVELYLDHEKYPYRIEEGTLFFERGYGERAPLFAAMEFDAATGKVPKGAGDTFPKVRASEIRPDVVRLEGNYKVLPTVGNFLVLRHGKRVHPGILLQYSSDITLEQLYIHQTGGLGIAVQFCEDIKAAGVHFVPNKERGRRFLTGHADGLHFSNNKGIIVVENCSFEGLMDDSINVHGTSALLETQTGKNSVTGMFCHSMSKAFPRWAATGHSIGFINPKTRACEAVAIVKEYHLLSEERFELTFEGEVPREAEVGYALENLTNTPAVICRNNYFGNHRARGILVTTPKPVLIENNRFESSGCAVLLAGDMNEWYESGTCQDVTIRKNVFYDCCSSEYQFCHGVIDVEPGIGKEENAMVHSNIRIEDNEFYLVSDTLLYAEHVENMLLKGNRIILEDETLTPKYDTWKCKNVSCEETEI